jgi:glycine cleavage system H protein
MAAAEAYPEDLRYHPEHDWARIEDGEATFGITWFAQDALGELVHFEAPEEGATLTKDEAYAEVESVKAVSDVIAPLSGEVVEVNPSLTEHREQVNQDPYGAGWLLIVVALADPGELAQLMSAADYEAHLQTAGGPGGH